MPYEIPQWTKSPPDASTPKLLSSYSKAPGADLTPISVDKENGVAEFSGRHGNYIASLSNCQCGSFPKPCKHMFRLAMELGLMAGKLSSNPTEAENRYAANVTRQITLEDAVAELENYSEDGQRFVMHVLTFARHASSPPVREKESDGLLAARSCPLLDFQQVCSADVMNTMRKKDIAAMLSRINIQPPDKMKLADLIPWCLQNVSNIKDELPKQYDVSCVPAYRRVSSKVYTYLIRKYENYSFNQRGDSSSEEVNRLLAFYGHDGPVFD